MTAIAMRCWHEANADWLSPEGVAARAARHRPARCKAHLDGIANALGINDKHFGSPTVTWADKTERGKLIVSLG
jgi:hypothetical protein